MKKITLIIIALFAISYSVSAQKFSYPELQSDTLGTFDLKQNTVSNIDFFVTNYGINFCNISKMKGGLLWPRGKKNQYFFADGFWFGAKKLNAESNELRKMVLISYNPNSGKGWTVPGRIEDGYEVQNDLKKKYRAYFSTDYNTYTGEPYDSDYEYNWSHWISNGEKKYSHGIYLNEYENDNSKRNRDIYTNGPLFVSDEDIISTFKDTDINYYEGGIVQRTTQGYPLNMQIESSIYSWGEGDLQDVMILRYVLENKSSDTLYDCWFGKISDVDIGVQQDTNGFNFAGNDRVRYFNNDPTLNLVVAWTNTDRGELGQGFGYIGMSMLETPAIDAQGFIRNDKLIYESNEMLGLTTFNNWSIEFDPKEDDSRYDFLSREMLDGDNGPGDKRTLLSSGPFNFRPNEKAHFTVLIAFALPAKGGEADGTALDIEGLPGGITNKDNPEKQSSGMSLIDKIKFASDKYYNNLVMKILESDIQKDRLNIFPNPASDFIAIQTSEVLETSDVSKVQIFDILGIEIKDLTQALSIGEGVRIDISHLPAGVYFIKVGDKIGKFVKK